MPWRCSALRIALGEQAAIEFFGGAADLYCANFDEVFHAKAGKYARHGVVGGEFHLKVRLPARRPVHQLYRRGGRGSACWYATNPLRNRIVECDRSGSCPDRSSKARTLWLAVHTCRTPSAARCPAMPKARDRPPPTCLGGPSSERVHQFGLQYRPMPFRTTRFAQPHAFRHHLLATHAAGGLRLGRYDAASVPGNCRKSSLSNRCAVVAETGKPSGNRRHVFGWHLVPFTSKPHGALNHTGTRFSRLT